MSSQKTLKEEIPLLLYPPLIEAIFELHWELVHDKERGRFRDPSYPMMYGRMYEKIKEDFPFVEDLPSMQMDPEANPYLVRHRMRKEKNGYPLIQMGPGIATVNFAKGYSWTLFKEHILNVIASVIDLYPEEIHPLRLIRSEVRFLNGVPIGPKNENPLAFLEEKLHTKVEIDPDFFRLNQMYLQPHSVNLNLAYNLQRPLGHLGISIQSGQMGEMPAYVFQTLIQSSGEGAASTKEAFERWLDDAHDVAENSFCTLCKGSLMEKFCGL